MHTQFRSLMVLLLALALLITSAANATVNLTIQGNQDRGAIKPFMGCTHGFSQGLTYPAAIMSSLKFGSWRLANWWQYDYAINFTNNITFVISDVWGYSTNPASNWTAYEQCVANVVNQSISGNRPVAYWDIWNEPDSQWFWNSAWSYNDLLATFKHAHDVIKGILPNAKICGPSFSRYAALDFFNGKTTAQFITDLYNTYGIKLESVSWHQCDGAAWNIPAEVAEINTAIAAIGGGYAPALGINEWGQQDSILYPAMHALFVYEMDKCGVSYADIYGTNIYTGCSPLAYFDSCWNGLMALLMHDNVTPQHNYWFWKWHGEETGVRLVSNEPDGVYTTVCASKDSTAKTIKAFIPRFDKGYTEDVVVTVQNYPFSGTSATVNVKCLADAHQVCGGDAFKPLEVACSGGPTQVSTNTVPVSNGNLSFTISSVAAYAVYFVTITDSTVALPGKALSPNPANAATNVSNTVSLNWTAGSGATSHDVYFGTSNPPTFKVNQSGTTYAPGTLLFNTLYYWRIDEKNGSGTTVGDVWSFTTWPNVYKPNGVGVGTGTYSSGNLASVQSDDNNYYVIGNSTSPGIYTTFTVAQPKAQITSLRVTLRSKDSQLLSNTRKLYLYNYDTNQNDLLTSNSVSTSESNITYTVTSNPGKYVYSTNNQVSVSCQHVRSSGTHTMSTEYVEIGVNGG